MATLKPASWKCTVDGAVIATTGIKSLKALPYKDGRRQNTVTRFITVFADQAPKRYGYKTIRSYPHDRQAFTQGLLFDSGLLYESTGQETESSLRETDITTGKPNRQLNLAPSLFGEGIALYGDRIFQVTWQNNVGFVYDKSTFRQLHKFYYSTEGWGLTTMDNKIVMSDGSNTLSFHNPETFAVAHKIEVYDNEKKVDNLNELEYIEGEIWANIWMTDQIARIDPVSGKVNGYIDLEGIFPANERNPEADVLNGIAYDKATKRIFVTGKKWAKLYEIVITE
ncbi:MAG: glutaminyl-peptide cyclotransferase [Bacteroidales bacterium]|nr:glutaminyl-peptide cyclotransferase [Bacteroidales bacterium]